MLIIMHSLLYMDVWQSKQRELGDVLDLSSYLLKPIQRLSKYAQLLKQIAKECPGTHPTYADLLVSSYLILISSEIRNEMMFF